MTPSRSCSKLSRIGVRATEDMAAEGHESAFPAAWVEVGAAWGSKG